MGRLFLLPCLLPSISISSRSTGRGRSTVQSTVHRHTGTATGGRQSGRTWRTANKFSSAHLDPAQPSSTGLNSDFKLRHDVEIQKNRAIHHHVEIGYPSSQSLNPRHCEPAPMSGLSRQQLVRICAVCTKYRYWPDECREGLHHQTSTNPPPTTKANATPGGPTPTIEARHLQFISTLVLPGCPVLVCRRPCVCPGPHHQLTDELPHLDRHTPPPPGHLLSSPPRLVQFQSSSRPNPSVTQSLSGPPLAAFLPVCRLHTPSPLQSQCILVGPGFCCFCLCSQLAYAASPRLSKDPVNGWPTTGQHETPWVGLAWSVKAARACARA